MPDTVPVRLVRRSLPDRLRYLASKLIDGTADSVSVALALEATADEYAANGDENYLRWMLDCAEVAGRQRLRAANAKAGVVRLRAELDAMREDQA